MKTVGKQLHRPMKVLILNRDAGARKDLEACLRSQAGCDKFNFLLVENDEEAFKLFSEEHPDLLLIATNDEFSNSRNLCRKIRSTENERHTGIIFVGGAPGSEGELSVECLEIGGDDFIRADCSPEELMARVRAVLRLKAMTDELRSANHRLRVLSMTDELTGLANMRHFSQLFGGLVRRCRKGRIALGVIMMDLDHFKNINDSTNHLVGSYVLGEVGRLIRQSRVLGQDCVTARYGGDEFIIGLEAVGLSEVIEKAEMLRTMIAGAQFSRDGIAIRVNCSLGGAWVCKGYKGPAEEIIKAADLMLYRSKNRGRNCVSGMCLDDHQRVEHFQRILLSAPEGESDEDELSAVS